MMQFTVSLVMKQRCFLDQPAWKADLWNGLTKSPQNELVDILVNLPGYLQDLALVQQGTLSKATLISHLEADLLLLHQWRWRWGLSNPHGARELPLSSLPSELTLCNNRAYHDVLWFESFTQSTEVLLYNAVLICTLGMLAHISPKQYSCQSPLASISPLHLPYHQTSLTSAAVEICRAFEYQLINVSGSREASYFWLLPLGVAGKILQNNVLYKPWVDEMLEASKNLRSHGNQTSEFAFGYWSFLDCAAAQEEQQTLSFNL